MTVLQLLLLFVAGLLAPIVWLATRPGTWDGRYVRIEDDGEGGGARKAAGSMLLALAIALPITAICVVLGGLVLWLLLLSLTGLGIVAVPKIAMASVRPILVVLALSGLWFLFLGAVASLHRRWRSRAPQT